MRENTKFKNKKKIDSEPSREKKIKKHVSYDYKRSGNNSLLKVFIGAESFKEMATKGYYSDKSLLINEIINKDDKVLLLSMPRRWGKSINLDMLRRFLTNVDDDGKVIEYNDRSQTDNYKLFVGGDFRVYSNFSEIKKKVLKSKLIQEYPKAEDFLGTFPVIYIDFKNCKQNSIQDVKDAIKESLRLAFIQHEYIVTSLNEIQKLLWGKFTSEITTLDDLEIKNALHWLSEWLHKYHGKKVWILIDEYDAALNNAYININNDEEIKSIKDLFISMYSKTLKNNKFMEKAVLTGILELALSDGNSGLNNIVPYSINNFNYARYYGLAEKEVKDLCEGSNIQQVKEWYNGYHLKDNDESSYNFYNVWSTFNYLSKKEIKLYWQNTDSFNFLSPFFKHTAFLPALNSLIHLDEEIKFNLESKFDIKDFKTLKEIRNSLDQIKISSHGFDLFYSYLFFNGYLTKSEQNGVYRCPNKEIKVKLSKEILQGYERVYGFDTNLIKKMSEVLQELLNSINTNINIDSIKTIIEELQEKYQKILDEIKFVDRESDAVGLRLNEDCLHSLMNMAVFLTLESNQGTEVYTKKIIGNRQTKDKGRADIVLMNKNVGIIIEVRYNGNVESALQQAKEYTALINKCRHKIFVGLNIDNSKQATLKMDMH